MEETNVEKIKGKLAEVIKGLDEMIKEMDKERKNLEKRVTPIDLYHSYSLVCYNLDKLVNFRNRLIKILLSCFEEGETK